jgi:hypothetical protein
MIDAFNARIAQLDRGIESSCQTDVDGAADPDGCGQCNPVEGETYIQGADLDDSYIDELMQYVADETVVEPYNATCTWDIDTDNVTFVLTSFDGNSIEEYTVPKTDLSGSIDQDIDYIMESINS